MSTVATRGPVWRDKVASFAVRAAVGSLLLLSLGAPAAVPDRAQMDEAANRAARVRWHQLVSLTTSDNAKILDVGETAARLNAEIPLSTAPVEAMAPFRAIAKSSPDYAAALTCLTQAIYYEAATEPLAGKRAVAQVVLNRLRHPAYPATVCGVVYEGWNQPVCQFSFVCDGSLRRQPMVGPWRESRRVAEAALAGAVEPLVGSATHYHADYVLPRWAYTLGKVQQIGRHIFYRFPGAGGRLASFSTHWRPGEAIPRVDLARFDAVTEESADAITLAGLGDYVPRDPTDRRTDSDLGGRIDPNKAWRLTIPDPVAASAGYQASLRNQSGAAASQEGSLAADAGGPVS